MKKLFFLSAIVIALFSVTSIQASTLNKIVIEDTDEVVYQEIATDSVAAEIIEVINGIYPGLSIDKAYEGSDESFKFEISKGDIKKTVIYKKDGKLEEME